MVRTPVKPGLRVAPNQSSAHSLQRFARQYGGITLILLLASVLYFFQLGKESFWVDELYSVHDAQDLFSIGLIRPGYFVPLHFWLQISSNDAWLRSLSIPFGLGSVWLTYQIGRRANGELTGIVAALMLALSPLYINFVQMVRMYSFANFLGLAGTLALMYALERPHIRLYKALWAGLRVLVMITAPLNSTLLFADIVIIAMTFRRHRKVLINFGTWLVVIGVLWLPSLLALVFQTLDFLGGALDVADKVGGDSSRHGFPSLKDVILRLRNFTASPFPPTSRLVSLFYQSYTLLMLGLLSLTLVRKRVSPQLIWISIWTFVPAAAFFVVSQRLWIDRYLIFLAPFVIILLAAGFVRLWQMKRAVGIGVAIFYLVAVAGGLHRYYSVQDREDWRGVSQAITAQAQAGDVIVFSEEMGSPKLTTALAHYYQENTPIYRVEGICPTSETADGAIAPTSDLPTISSRMWLICGEGFDEEAFDQQFGDRFQMQTHQQFTYHNFYRDDSWMNLFLVIPRS
jgi:4-amino-4-deoxy-L-arabinose transferase-like glycosyltransferase